MNKENWKEEFFNEIYDTTFYNLRKYIRRRCNDPTLVDDVLQEVYLEAFRHIDDLRTHENSIGWIYKTAENKIKKLNSINFKLITNEIAYDERIEDIPDKNSESDYILYEEYKEILLEDEYDLLIKKYLDGYSPSDLAEMTGTTVAGSKMKLSRIIKKLKNNLKADLFLIFY